jgi:signal transduction histidine kinase
MKIRWRLTWFGICFTALVLVGFILLISILVVGSASQDQEELLADAAGEAADALGSVDVVRIDVSIPPVLPAAATSDQTFITVYDTDGVVIYGTGVVDGEPLELPTSVVKEALETETSSASFLGVRTEVRRWESRDGVTGVVAASQSERVVATRDIAHEADRMSGLIDDLLMLARSDVRADATKDFTPVDLGTIARSVQRRARNLELSVEVRAPDTAIVRRLDGELAELIWLLVDNADLHGGAEALVTIDREDEDVVLEVIDNGSGVPDEALDRVFDRFHRADPARSGSGYGLGLAIARSITERHGGTIGAANGPDGGAAFTVRLPAAN